MNRAFALIERNAAFTGLARVLPSQLSMKDFRG
jgi:hypothetical protein